jgi:hypothetical protein
MKRRNSTPNRVRRSNPSRRRNPRTDSYTFMHGNLFKRNGKKILREGLRADRYVTTSTALPNMTVTRNRKVAKDYSTWHVGPDVGKRGARIKITLPTKQVNKYVFGGKRYTRAVGPVYGKIGYSIKQPIPKKFLSRDSYRTGRQR